MAEDEVKLEWTHYGVKVIDELQILNQALKDPSYVMRSIGALILAQATRTFGDQGLGNIHWKPRYPNQKPPIINIAGSLQLLNKGKIPGAGGGLKLFQRRPALMASGDLKKSVAEDASGALRLLGTHVVEAGSVLPYAGTMQWGGKSTQPVTDTAKKTLAKWMKTLSGERREIASFGKSKKEWGPPTAAKKSKKKTSAKRGTPKKPRKGTSAGKKPKIPEPKGLDGGQRKAFRQKSNEINRAAKLGFLFNKSQLVTTVNARPFLGITTRSQEEIQKVLQDWIANYVSR